MKGKVSLCAFAALMISSTAHSETLSPPSTTREFLEACRSETIHSLSESFRQGYCIGLIDGMVKMHFKTNAGTPGISYRGFIQRASIIQKKMESQYDYWADNDPTSLILEVFKTVKLDPCVVPNQMCYYGGAVFESEEQQNKIKAIIMKPK